jgi:hypothetical protein
VRTIAAAVWAAILAAAAPPAGVFIQETFDTANLASRGWYDNTRPSLSTKEHVGSGGSSIEYTFLAGATKPVAGSPIRKKFGPSDGVYLSYHVKYGANWVGSQKPYHPHEFHLLTTLDDDWAGLSFTHLTVYVEQNGGTPLVAIQDGKNVDQSNVGKSLSGVTERRAVAGCNGSTDGYPDNCYRAAEGYVNEKKWKASSKLFSDDKWHFIEAYVRLNTVAHGVGVSDGVIQYWFDRQLVIDHRNVLLRTAANASMAFNQFVIAPYIGDGSPVAQSMWIDDVTVAASRP